MSAGPAFKAAPVLSMVDGCLTSLPAHFTKACHPFLSLPARSLPRVIHLTSCSSSSSSSSSSLPLLSLGRRSPLVPLVAQTSDWARQEEEEDEWEEGKQTEGKGEESRFSDWEGEGVNQVVGVADTDWEEGEQTDGAAADGLDAAAGGLSEWDEEEGEEVAIKETNALGSVAVGEGEEGEETADYPEPPEEAKLFVGNLPYDMDSEKLAQLFDPAGVVEVAEVIYNRETDWSRGFGFVTMSTVEEAEKAIEMFHRHYVEGRLLTVNKAAPRGSLPERTPREFAPSFRIYVGNLPWSVDDSRLEQVFSEYGKVVYGRVLYDRETGRSRGFGFVAMSSQQEMDDAIAALDGQNLDGRTIRVNAAEERPRRESF